nr:hypothetical protein CFP56_76851 [Quercus suber]
MFQLCSKLKKQKVVLKKLNKEEFSNLPDRVKRAKESMEAAQEFVQLNPMNGEGIRAEVMAVHEYALLRRSEESFYKKKSRVQWLSLGDQNTRFFFKAMGSCQPSFF